MWAKGESLGQTPTSGGIAKAESSTAEEQIANQTLLSIGIAATTLEDSDEEDDE